MVYQVLFQSSGPEASARDIVRMLRSLPVSVVSVESPDGRELGRSAGVPLVTLSRDPGELATPLLGLRGWIAILPDGQGSRQAFADAGATVVLCLPVERAMLLSAVARCIAAFGDPDRHPPDGPGPSGLHHRRRRSAIIAW